MNKRKRDKFLVFLTIFFLTLILFGGLFLFFKGFFTGYVSRIVSECTDSDGPNNFFISSNVLLKNKYFYDYCEGDFAYDYSCSSDAAAHATGQAISKPQPSTMTPPPKNSKNCQDYGGKYSCFSGKCSEEVITSSVKNCSFVNHSNCIEVKSCGVLNETNAYYLLMNDLSSDNDCINILSKISSGETLPLIFDLNGHVIIFGNVKGINQQGIYIDGSNNRKSNIEIKNGYVIQGFGGGEECASIRGGYWNPNKEIHHLNLFTWGTNCQNIRLSGGKNISVHDNYLEQNVSLVTDRQNKAISQIGISGQGKIGTEDFSFGGYLKIYNNVLRGKGQMGIVVGRSQSGSGWGNYTSFNVIQGMNISYNDISMEGVVANPYAIIVNGYEANEFGVPVVHDNYIKQKNARGIDLDGIDDLLGMKGGLVYNNYIDTKQGCLIDNRGGDFHGYSCGTHSLRIRTSDSYYRIGGGISNPYGENSNNIFINNTIIARQGEPIPGGNLSGYGYAVRISIRDYNKSLNMTFINNTFVAFVNSSFFSDGTEDHDVAAVYTNDIIPGNNILFENNQFISNYRPLYLSGCDTLLLNNKIIRSGIVNNNYDPFILGYWTARATDNIFFNQSFVNSPGFESMAFDGADGGNLKNFSVSWFLDLYVKDSNNNPVPQASVAINNFGDFTFGGSTDSYGFLRVSLNEFKKECNFSPCTPITTNYNPYSLIIGKQGYASNSSSFSISQSMVKEVRLNTLS